MEPEEKKIDRLHIRIESTLLTKLKEQARQERLPFSLWVRRILWKLIPKQ